MTDPEIRPKLVWPTRGMKDEQRRAMNAADRTVTLWRKWTPSELLATISLLCAGGGDSALCRVRRRHEEIF